MFVESGYSPTRPQVTCRKKGDLIHFQTLHGAQQVAGAYKHMLTQYRGRRTTRGPSDVRLGQLAFLVPSHQSHSREPIRMLDSLPHRNTSSLRAATRPTCSLVHPQLQAQSAHRVLESVFAKSREQRVRFNPGALSICPLPELPRMGRGVPLSQHNPSLPRDGGTQGSRTLTGDTSAARRTDSPSLHRFQSESPPRKPEGRILAPGPARP